MGRRSSVACFRAGLRLNWEKSNRSIGGIMQRHASRLRICISLVLALTGLSACAESVNPVRPSLLSGPETAATAVTPAPALPGRPTFQLGSEHKNAIAQAVAGHLTPTDLTNRGWGCFEPIPNRIVCSHPNQGFPTVGTPPPDDRPASFTFLVFDETSRFVGTELLLRTDRYNGQLCESTGQPYDFVDVIGYYECIHTTGR